MPRSLSAARAARAGRALLRGPSLGYSWRVLTPLPLLAALLGVALAAALILAGIASTTRQTQHRLAVLAARSRDAGHLWVDVSIEYTDAAQAAGPGAASPSALLSIEQAAADASRRLAALHFEAMPSAGALGGLYTRLAQDDQRADAPRQAFLQAAAAQAGRTGAAWLVLQPLLEATEADAAALANATDAAYPAQAAAAMRAGQRADRRLLAVVLALVAAEFSVIAIWAGRVVARPLRRFAEAARAIRDGNLDVHLPRFAVREFTLAADGFNAMAISVRQARAHEREMRREALVLREEREALIQRQLAAVIEAQEEERRRVARELHDEAAQALTAVHLGLQRLAHGVPAQVREEVRKMQALVRDTGAAVRDLAVNLHPHVLDEMGLVPALQEWVQRLASAGPPHVEFAAAGDIPRLPVAIETAVFRIAQEAVTNAVRHSETAEAVRVRLRLTATHLHLQVADDGRGFEAAPAGGQARPGLGLLGMRERARQIGAEFSVHSAPGRGTRVELRVPLARPAPRPGAAVE